MKNYSVAIKSIVCKFSIAALLVLSVLLVSAVVEGTMPLWAGIVAGIAALLVLNVLCGLLLPSQPQAEKDSAAPLRRGAPSLRVVHGSRAA